MKDISDAAYLWIYKKLLTQWIIKYCHLNLTTTVLKAYQITGLNPTFLNHILSTPHLYVLRIAVQLMLVRWK